MPEAKLALSHPVVEPPKRPPIIKVSCGIGDTDGFPAFDVESDTYAATDDPKWGFRITGGAEFHMPITVFQVTDGGLADKGGIRLGDIIVDINDTDVTSLPLAKVQEIIDASAKKIFIIARGMEDDEMNEEPQEEEKSIVLRVPKPLPPPKEFTPTPLLGTRVWHPIMWQEPPPPPKEKKHKTKVEIVDGEEVVIELSEEESSDDEEEEELPHHRIIRNIRRFFTENKDNEDLRSRTIEDMLLILPASIEERLREMQRKLSEIAEIPKILSSTLETVSQTFDKFLPPQANFEKTQLYESDDLDSVSDDNDEILTEPDSLEYESKYKDLTPESDYVSETNDEDDDLEQVEKTEDESESESGDDQQYTWNSSNVPEVTIEETEEEEPEPEPTAEDIFKQEKQEKIEKLERAWPWADREKIIYRQSTCHLVPRQPLGIVDDRIKLLARRNISAVYERMQAEH